MMGPLRAWDEAATDVSRPPFPTRFAWLVVSLPSHACRPSAPALPNPGSPTGRGWDLQFQDMRCFAFGASELVEKVFIRSGVKRRARNPTKHPPNAMNVTPANTATNANVTCNAAYVTSVFATSAMPATASGISMPPCTAAVRVCWVTQVSYATGFAPYCPSSIIHT